MRLWILLLALAFLIGHGLVYPAVAKQPSVFIEVRVPVDNFKAFRINTGTHNGCLLVVATSGMGSPKPTLGCW